MTPPKNTSNDPVKQYALDVVEGREIAGPLVRKACQRHLDDLEHGHERGLWWDWPAAEYVIGYFRDVLRLAGGEHEGRPFILQPSQMFIVGSIFGWKGEDGARRFRVAYIEQAKGSGKSPLAAGIGLYMLTADGESRAEVYAAAVDKDQAKVLFRDAVAMVNQSEALSARIKASGGPGREFNLAHLESGSFFKPISSESKGRGKSGPRPHCAILDEVHEHPTAAMVEFMRAGTKGRKQALVLMITNSGVVDPGSVCWQYHEYSDRLLDGLEENDALFAYVCGLDKGDSWQDLDKLPIAKKANPLVDVGVPPIKYLAEQVREAKGMPSKASIVRRLNGCEWVESIDPWISKEVWDLNGAPVDEGSLEGRSCFAALDLSKRHDLTALVLIFPNDDEPADVLVYAWTPEQGLRDREHRDKAPYLLWVEQGYLRTTPGPTIDYEFVAQKIGEITKRFTITAMAFDHWHFDDMARELNKAGVDINCIDHAQGHAGMNHSIEAAEEGLKNGMYRHGGNPLLTACVFNVRVVPNAENLRMFEKKKQTARIDAAQSFVMAAGIAASQPVSSDIGAVWV